MFPAFFLVVGAVGAGLMVKHTDATSRYQSLVAEAHDGIVLVDEQDRVLESNPTARLLLGLPENPSESLPSLLGEALHPPLDRQLAIIRRDGKERGEYRLELAGRSVFLEILGSRLESDRILLLFRDLTERRALEDRLLRSTRLETAGRVAGGIALELGDLMQVILTHAGAMRARLVSLGQSDSADPEPLDRLDRVTGAAQEAAHLARRLGTLGSEGTPLSKPFSIEDLLVDAASLARPSLPPHTSLTVSMAEPIPPLEGEADALLHALMNLIGNARDAVAPLASPERRGLIRVVARRTTLEGAVPGVLIVVEDNGPGIPPEQRSRIFDAFWSTKSPTKGSGLGLTLVWNLVRELGGDIRVEDATTGGASIRVRLPLKRTLEAPRDASVDDAEPA
jgi:signal transduction histidine kinase